MSVQTFQPLIVIYRRAIFCIILGDVHKFITHCLIPLDPCPLSLSLWLIMYFLNDFKSGVKFFSICETRFKHPLKSFIEQRYTINKVNPSVCYSIKTNKRLQLIYYPTKLLLNIILAIYNERKWTINKDLLGREGAVYYTNPKSFISTFSYLLA